MAHRVHLFNLRRKEDENLYYPIIKKWWEDWKMIPLTPDSLPETGVMISNEGTFICCGFLYRTDSSICVLGWLISDRQKRNRPLRKGSLELLITTLEKLGKNMGYKHTFVPARNPSLVKKLESQGYNTKDADCQMTNFIKQI